MWAGGRGDGGWWGVMGAGGGWWGMMWNAAPFQSRATFTMMTPLISTLLKHQPPLATSLRLKRPFFSFSQRRPSRTMSTSAGWPDAVS